MEGAGKLRNSKVKLMWWVGGGVVVVVLEDCRDRSTKSVFFNSVF